ncbi:hypothetical protein [Rheinheimera sp. 4Y26]|uniref:hypothetical protein n=1 Tax=Rheinheimera sp. 4Y26 TaxID=2977811 RepID=UPI0021B0B6E1|nr:hypothetical protein [Rheinheimera sp. 4Y26]MCT6699977.1 hypothetical protein [Rheinheimera sp. 4Y26]
MVKFKSYLMALILGIALAVASVVIFGYGAAASVSADLLNMLMPVSAFLAFVVVDFFIIALPLALAFLLLAYAAKFVFKSTDHKFYLLLLAPLVLLQGYYLLSASAELNGIISMLLRFLLLALCYYAIVRSNQAANA